MCQVIKIGEGTAIICGGKKDHACNEDGRVYGLRSGERVFFKSDQESQEWYKQNYPDTLMGSVCCSICGGAAIDSFSIHDF